MFIISMKKPCLLKQVANAVIIVANKSGLLPTLAIPRDSAPIGVSFIKRTNFPS